jgi:transcription elongation factor GreA
VTVTQEIRKAMADKDFRENAPLDAAKERQGRIETQIRQLESTIASAQILSGSSNGGEIARSAVGTRITVKDKDSGEILDYTLVDAREADTGQRRISIQSPVGQALLDLGAGDEVAVPTPKGTLTYVVEGVTAA